MRWQVSVSRSVGDLGFPMCAVQVSVLNVSRGSRACAGLDLELGFGISGFELTKDSGFEA